MNSGPLSMLSTMGRPPDSEGRSTGDTSIELSRSLIGNCWMATQVSKALILSRRRLVMIGYVR